MFTLHVGPGQILLITLGPKTPPEISSGIFSASCQVPLEVAKDAVLAVQTEDRLQKLQLQKEKVAETGMQLIAEAMQRRSKSEKMLFREEVAERRGATAKRSPSEEVTLQRSCSLIRSSVTSFLHSLFH